MVKSNGFEINHKRLALVMRTVYDALKKRQGIFEKDPKMFLPQWNLPAELEFSPMKTETVDPEKAAIFLFLRNQLDRRQSSSSLHKKVMAGWYDSQINWIFDSKQVSQRELSDIEYVFREKLGSNLPVHPKMSIAQGYFINCRSLNEIYDSDPRNLVRYKTVYEARKHIMNLHGFGTGLANLFMIELFTRAIAQPTDSYNLRPKIDVHKARVPINSEVVALPRGKGLKHAGKGLIHMGTIAKLLENAYVEVAKAEGIPIVETEQALWIIGSRVCTKRNYVSCRQNCPLVDRVCTAMTPLSVEAKGYYILKNPQGQRPDDRNELGQGVLDV